MVGRELLSARFVSEANLYLILSAVPYGNYGCRGGNMYDAFLYIVANDGVDTDSSYPYRGQVKSLAHTCMYWPPAIDSGAMSIN